MWNKIVLWWFKLRGKELIDPIKFKSTFKDAEEAERFIKSLEVIHSKYRGMTWGPGKYFP